MSSSISQSCFFSGLITEGVNIASILTALAPASAHFSINSLQACGCLAVLSLTLGNIGLYLKLVLTPRLLKAAIVLMRSEGGGALRSILATNSSSILMILKATQKISGILKASRYSGICNNVPLVLIRQG